MRLGAAALPPRTQPGPNTSPSTVTAVIPSRARDEAASTPVDQGHPFEQPVHRGPQPLGAGHDVEGPPRPAGQGRPPGPVHHARRLGHEQTRAPRVVGAQPADRRGRAGQRVDGERIAGPAQRGGDRDLVTRLDLQQRRDRTRDRMRVVAGREQRGGAVLAAQAQLQGLHPGGGGLPVALGGPLLLAQLLELGFQPVEVGGGLLVARVEVLLARLLGGDRRLQRGELALGLGGAGPSGLDGVAHPAELALGGLDPGRLGRHLPGQPGQALAAVGDRAGDPREALLLRRIRLLDLGPGGHGDRERGLWRRRSRRRAPRAARAGRPPGGAAPRGRGWTHRSPRRAPRPRGPRGAAGRAPTPATRSR